jgi:hypothetical protein
MKVTGKDPRKTGPIARLYDIVVEIVDGTRKAMVQSGAAKKGQPIDIRLPILMAGTDLRVIIEAGPSTAVRNAIEHAQMNATEKPVTNDLDEAAREACALLAEYASEVQRGGMAGDQWMNEKDRQFFLRIGTAMRALDALMQIGGQK